MTRIVVALGGNALTRPGRPATWAVALEQMRAICHPLVELVEEGNELVLTHGNGPQVGAMLRQNELAEREVPPRPLQSLVAETQGELGFLIAQELTRALAARSVRRSVVVLISRVEVSMKDPAFKRPTKPVGSVYPDAEARLLRKRQGWQMAYDGARHGWQRLLPSPRPVDWVEKDAAIRLLGEKGAPAPILIVAGGGGVPVVRRAKAGYEGVDAVVDKDRSASLVARSLGAEVLAIVTDVPAVAVGFGKPWEKWLGEVGVDELRSYLTRGEFAEGSMAPKVEAALEFVEETGGRAVICDGPALLRALEGRAGTRVRPG